MPLADAAAERDLTYQAAKKARHRAEHRLVAHLHDSAQDTAPDGTPAGRSERDLATQVADAVTITDAADHAIGPTAGSRRVTDLATHAAKKVSGRVSPEGQFPEFRGAGRDQPPPRTPPPRPPSRGSHHRG